jgi:hypothetical protein
MPKRLVPSRIGQWLYQLEALRTPVGHFICWRVYEWLPKVPINKEKCGVEGMRSFGDGTKQGATTN